MTRETKEQRELRKAEEEREALAALAAYHATVPKRLMEAAAIAQTVGVSTNITLSESGPQVRFYDESSIIDDILHYETEEWRLEHLERKLRELKDEQDARKLRRTMAEDVWKNKLSDKEKEALKEFISYLR